jgi:hypothetical protein
MIERFTDEDLGQLFPPDVDPLFLASFCSYYRPVPGHPAPPERSDIAHQVEFRCSITKNSMEDIQVDDSTGVHCFTKTLKLPAGAIVHIMGDCKQQVVATILEKICSKQAKDLISHWALRCRFCRLPACNVRGRIRFSLGHVPVLALFSCLSVCNLPKCELEASCILDNCSQRISLNKGDPSYHPANTARFCAGCNMYEPNPKTFLICGHCKVTSYCSKACQKTHWKKEHKKACKEFS